MVRLYKSETEPEEHTEKRSLRQRIKKLNWKLE